MDYQTNFQDNILSYEFNQRSEGILNWIQENREKEEWAKDPNAYELTNVFLLGAKYAQEKQNVNLDTLDKMWQIRSKDFARCGIGEESFIYQICQDAHNSAMEKKALVNDENSHHALRKMAGIGLYLKQQQRDGQEVTFNNPGELMQLMECSKTLKTFHQELFDRYKFKQNIDAILKLQLQQDLPQELANRLNKAHENLMESALTQKGVKQEINKEQEIE